MHDAAALTPFHDAHADVRFNTVTKLHAAPGNDGPDGLCTDTSPGNSTNQDPDPCEIWDIESFYYLNIT